MAKKKKSKGKIAFGIFQEGLSVKIAQLIFSDGKIDIQRLEASELSYPLYVKEVAEEKESSEEAKDIDLLKDIEGEDLDIPELSDLDTSDEFEEIEKEEILTGKDDLKKMLIQFPLESGKIALNATVEQIEYHQFDENFGTKGLAKKLKNEIIPKEERKSKNYSLQYIVNQDKSILAFVHRGEFELLNAVQEINPILSKKIYFYDLIDTDEIALMYLLRQSYDLSPEEYTLIIYLGNEKSGFILKGYNFIRRFPITVIDTMMDSIPESIFSKMILELDIADIPNPTRILMAGGLIDEGDIIFFRDKFDSNTIIERFKLEKIYQKSEDRLDITAEKVAEFAIPISLAWKTLDKKKKYFPCNLLPKKIIEKQKHFRLAWHGYIVFGAIFFFAFTATTRNMQLIREYVKLNKLKLTKDIELREKEGIVKIIKDVKIELISIQIELDKVKELIGTKNQWFYILQTLSNSFKKNKISWVTDLSNFQDKFMISAYTTKRKNIVRFSKLFPEGKIGNVYKTEIQGISAWEFEIEYSYPNPDDVAFYDSSIIIKSPPLEKIEKEEKPVKEIEPVVVQEVKPEQDEPVVVQEVKPEQDEPVAVQEVKPEQDELVAVKEVKPEQVEPVVVQEVKPEQDEPVVVQEVKPEQDESVVVKEVKPEQDEPVVVQEVKPEQDEPVVVKEVKPEQDEPVVVKEVKPEQDEPVVVKEVKPEQDEPVVVKEVKPEQDEPVVVKEVKPEQDEPVVVKEVKPEQTKEIETVEIGEVVSEQVEEKVVETTVTQTSLSNKEIKDLYQQITKIYFSGDYEEANLKYKDFVDKFPKHYLAYSANYLRGECLFLLGENSQAKAIFEKTVKLGGTRVPSALLMLGNLSHKENNFQQAKTYWDQLLKEYPLNPMAEIAAEKIKALNKNASSELKSINQIYFSGNFREAEKKYKEFITQNPDSKLVYTAKYLQGECLYLMGKLSEAIEIFKSTLKYEGAKTPDALIMLGNSYHKEKDLDKAISYWAQLVRRFPHNYLSQIAQKKISNIEKKNVIQT